MHNMVLPALDARASLKRRRGPVRAVRRPVLPALDARASLKQLSLSHSRIDRIYFPRLMRGPH